jgi:recombinational DNA repair ATPase RecF
VRLVQARVRGFKRLRALELDLDHERLLVVGPNEAGKSTLLEALVTGLYGLAAARRGSGHSAALKQVTPWTGEPAGLGLTYDLDDGRRIEVDWDLGGERTKVIDHGNGEDISATFATGTHGWLDIGDSLLHLPATVFRQVTCVGEGELARITDDVQVRQSLLRVTDAGVDVLVEQAIRRLEEAGRQATIPKTNAATRRNALARQLADEEAQLAAAQQSRAALEEEIEAIGRTERELVAARSVIAAIAAEEARREEARTRLGAEVERARGRLAEAERRLAALQAPRRPLQPERREWGDKEIERARQMLGAGPQGRPGSRITATALAACGLGALAIVAGIVLPLVPLDWVGALLVAAGVYLATRGSGSEFEDLTVAGTRYRTRQELMSAIDQYRARRDYSEQGVAVARLQGQLDLLLHQPALQAAPATRAVDTALGELSDYELELRSRTQAEKHQNLSLELAQRRASLERGARLIPEVSPLEERVVELRRRVDHLDAFGVACRLAAESLAQASEEIRRSYAPRLQAYLARDLARITDGRYVEALVSDKFEILLRAPENGSMVDLRHLSRGTQQQVYLLLRLGLLEVMGGDRETLPLFLDDALALADDERRHELLRVLEGEHRQVIYFTGAEQAAGVGFGPQWHRLVLSRPTSSEVERASPVDAPMRVVADRSA